MKVEYIINEVDMVTFGLVLNITNMNELEDRVDMKPHVRSMYTGASVFLIVLFGMFLGIAYFADLDSSNLIDKGRIKICSIVLSLISLFFSFTIYYRQKKDQDG